VYRRRLIVGAASSNACVYLFANLLGLDNARLVFDGGGFIATPEGVVAEAPILSREAWGLTTAVVDLDSVSRARAENSTWREASHRSRSEEVLVVEVEGGSHTPAPIGEFVEQMGESLYLPAPRPPVDEVKAYLDELFDALVLGLRDYFEKSKSFDRFLVALSGGRDSSLCCLLAVYAAKALRGGAEADRYAERVSTAYLPHGAYSSDATRDAARSLAEQLGVPFQIVGISEEADVALAKAGEMMGSLDDVTPIARQNLQARIRGAMMLNWSNSARGLVLVTSNLSEAAVGYTTTGGDNQGGYSPIANVPKTLVSRLLEHIAERDGLTSLDRVLALTPSAELAEDQSDEEDLMPYVVLDDLLFLFGRRRLALPDCWRILVHRYPERPPELLREWTARFGRLFAYNQWKREQLPTSLKVLELDLDPKSGFRFPVTQSIEAELAELAGAAL
jgi:NAD+ synthase (glutamine-hydrolysing)